MKIKLLCTVLITSLLCSLLIPLQASAADYGTVNIIDDAIMNNTTSMSAGQINTFLNGFAGTCLGTNSGFTTPDPLGYSSGAYQYGGNTDAGTAISHIATRYNLNPQVLIATLEKEQGLIDTTSCHPEYQGDAPAFYSWSQHQACSGSGAPYSDCAPVTCGSGTTYVNCSYACRYSGGCAAVALGYSCPGFCKKSFANFSAQISGGSWVLRFSEARAYGQLTGYAGYDSGDEYIAYSGPMTQGYRQRVAGGSSIYYDGSYTDSDGNTMRIANGSTASMLSYTPFYARSYTDDKLFHSSFVRWFGSTKTGQCLTSLTSVGTDVQFRKLNNRIDVPVFLITSGSGSGCVEAHIWGPGYGTWQAHIASNNPSLVFPDTKVYFADLDGTKQDYPIIMGLQNTSTGKIEAHVWNKDMQSFLVHAASNQNTISLADNSIDFADLNGDSREEPIIIAYQNTGSGMIELHGWSNGMQGWLYHIATNRASLNPTDNYVRFADLNGDGRVEAILVSVNNTGSGKIEFHIWNPGQSSWQDHIISNMPTINPADGRVVFADVDGNGIDEAVLIGMRNTGSGKIEFHIWNPGETSWRLHIASNQPTL